MTAAKEGQPSGHSHFEAPRPGGQEGYSSGGRLTPEAWDLAEPGQKALARARARMAADQVVQRRLVALGVNPGPWGVELDGELVDEAPGGAVRVRLALMWQLQSQARNHAILTKTKPTGETTTWTAPLFALDSPLSAAGLSEKARRQRKKVRQGVVLLRSRLEEAFHPDRVGNGYRHGYDPTLLTLTMRHPPFRNSVEWIWAEAQRFHLAFELFRKREPFVSAVAGSYRGDEFTLEETPDGLRLHYHGHVLCFAQHMERHLLQEALADCLNTATRKMAQLRPDLYTPEMVEGMLYEQAAEVMVDVRRVRGKSGKHGLDAAIEEVAKYATKPLDFASDESPLSDQTLLDLALEPRLPRMKELLGGMAPGRELPQGVREEADRVAALVEAQRAASWRRKQAYACPEAVAALAVNEAPEQAETPAGASSLDTPYVSDGGLDAEPAERASSQDPDPPPKRARGPSWRKLLQEMPLEPFAKLMWCRCLRARVAAIRRLLAQGFDGITVDGLDLQTAMGVYLDELAEARS